MSNPLARTARSVASRARRIRVGWGAAVGALVLAAVVWAILAGAADPDGRGNPSGQGAQAMGDAPVLGKSSAPVTIVEYGDFKCPLCTLFYV